MPSQTLTAIAIPLDPDPTTAQAESTAVKAPTAAPSWPWEGLDWQQWWQQKKAGLGTAGILAGWQVTQSLKDLPRTAQALAQEMPKLADRLGRAGLRDGAMHSEADIMALFNQIPGTSKLGAREWDIRVFLSGKDASHIYPHSRGGSGAAHNLRWEVRWANRARGAEVMTPGEQFYIRLYNGVDSVVKNSAAIARLGLTATGTAILTQALVTALAYSLDLYRGEITVEEFRDRITTAALEAGIATPIFLVLFLGIMALFPEVVVILSAPAVVAGFNALFGLSIALPLLQSLQRHIAATTPASTAIA